MWSATHTSRRCDVLYLILWDRDGLPLQGGALTLRVKDPFALAWHVLLGRGWVI